MKISQNLYNIFFAALRSTYPSGKSAVLQASNNHHGVNSVLQFGGLLRFAVRVAHLGDENV